MKFHDMMNIMDFLFVGLLLTFTCVDIANCKKVLIVPIQAPSHCIYLNAVGAGLVELGHSVYTIMGPQFTESKLKPFRQQGLKILTYKMPPGRFHFNTDDYHKQLMNSVINGTTVPLLAEMVYHDCEWMLEDAELMKNLQGIGLNMAVVDGFLPSQCGYLIPYILGIPFVTVSSAIFPLDVGIPALPSFVPFIVSLLSDKMTFIQRLQNFIPMMFASQFLNFLFPIVYNHTLLHKYNTDPTVSSWSDLFKKSELFILTRSYTLEWPTPVMPHLIAIECVTCAPGKPLPDELEEYMSDAPNGVILISFGSLAAHIPPSVQAKMLQTIANRPENFIWKVTVAAKTTLENMNTFPRNLKLMTWLPQNDILAHPNTKLFFTHCGNNGQYESLYHAVPMLGFPILGEQHHNCFRMAEHGFGECLDFQRFTVDEVLSKINQVVSNPNYKSRAVKSSDIIKSRPMSARQEAAYWIDHVMEFGSSHLKSSTIDMPWYSYWMLDILGFLLCVLVLVLYCIKTLISFIFQRLFSRKDSIKTKIN